MEKRTYIEPEMNVAVMPKYALMGFNNSPGEDVNPHLSPKRLSPANPALATDTVAVF
jgi:hypothetical protein